jgi:hypothetical protein
VKFWGDLHRMLLGAVRTGKPQSLRNLRAEMRAGTLYLRLPSGRELAYPEARIEAGQFDDQIVSKDNAIGKWRDTRGWHGTFCENVVQAVSRDLLAEAMQRLEAAGYPIVLHVHDEIVAEVPEGFGSPDEFAKLMTALPTWAEGLPLAAKARVSKRYAKEKNGTNAIPEDEPPIAEENDAPHEPEPEQEAPRHNGSGTNKRTYAHGEERKGQHIATYLYRDHRGKPHTRVEKWRSSTAARAQYPQSFWVHGHWVSKKPEGWLKIPYRLPELLEALTQQPIPHVFCPEGEKDCDTLAALGLIATTNAEGATPLKAKTGKWTPELNKWFHGVPRIFIPADNDEVGRRFAEEKARALAAIVPDIRIVLFPDVPEGEDVTWWLVHEHTKEELIARCEAAPRWNGAKLDRIRASEVEMTAVEWLWPNRFALGKLGLIVGLPEEGKGQILCYIAAQVTAAGPGAWPCGEGYAPKGNVVLLSAEDAIDDTVAPRLEAAGADRTRIEIVKMVREQSGERMFSLHTDLALLRDTVMDIGNVVLVLIDPISAYLGVGKVDSYRTTDVRAVLGPLVSLAAELKVAIIGIMHFNKKLDVTNVLLRISDSLAYGATARHVYGVVNDPDNHRKLVVRAKNNLAAGGADQTLAFSFTSREVGVDPNNDKPIVAPYVVWEAEHIDVSAMEAMQAANEFKSPTARDSAKQFLRELLINGPVASSEVDEAATANGISRRTLFRAKNELHIITKKSLGPDGVWKWHLPGCEDAAL